MAYSKPVPVPDDITAGFWQATSRHELAFQRCQHCQAFAHPPATFCAACDNLTDPSFVFEPVSGRGRIVNWTVMHDSMVAGFEAPWVNVLVEIEEQAGLYFVSMLDDGDVPGLQIGAQVETRFTDISDEISLPTFALVAEPDGR